MEKTREQIELFLKEHNVADALKTGDAAQDRLNRLETQYLDVVTQLKLLENLNNEDLLQGIIQGSTQLQDARKDSEDSSRDREPSRKPSMPEIGGIPEIAELRLEIRNLESEIAKWAKTLKPAHPFMVQLEERLKGLQSARTNQLQLVREQVDATLEKLRCDAASLTPIIEGQKQVVAGARRVQRDYESLKEDERDYKTRLERLENRVLALEEAKPN